MRKTQNLFFKAALPGGRSVPAIYNRGTQNMPIFGCSHILDPYMDMVVDHPTYLWNQQRLRNAGRRQAGLPGEELGSKTLCCQRRYFMRGKVQRGGDLRLKGCLPDSPKLRRQKGNLSTRGRVQAICQQWSQDMSASSADETRSMWNK